MVSDAEGGQMKLEKQHPQKLKHEKIHILKYISIHSPSSPHANKILFTE